MSSVGAAIRLNGDICTNNVLHQRGSAILDQAVSTMILCRGRPLAAPVINATLLSDSPTIDAPLLRRDLTSEMRAMFSKPPTWPRPSVRQSFRCVGQHADGEVIVGRGHNRRHATDDDFTGALAEFSDTPHQNPSWGARSYSNVLLRSVCHTTQISALASSTPVDRPSDFESCPTLLLHVAPTEAVRSTPMGAQWDRPPRPGWYPDPTGMPVQRYYNGAGWTVHRASLPSPARETTSPATELIPVPAAPAPPEGGTAAGVRRVLDLILAAVAICAFGGWLGVWLMLAFAFFQ